MRIKTIRLKAFKRFDDLTIDLGETPRKLVALVGPNGSGKSSVFDAFEQLLQEHVGINRTIEASFLSKTWFDATSPVQSFNKQEAIQVTTSPDKPIGPTSFYVRSAYRFTPSLKVNSIERKGDVVQDSTRPGSSAGLDQRLQVNYERMLGRLLTAFFSGEMTGPQTRQELIGAINVRLTRVVDIQITDLGDVSEGKGQLFFEKGSSKHFPFENLSAGEKEVVDLLIDFVVKAPTYRDTVYCIDEPELHLNTAIQRKLLIELADLIPEGSQLWVATHSIGFLRALQKDLADDSQIIDFSEKEYFSGTKIITPLAPTRSNWKRIFTTALEDLTGLLAPEVVVYCEGRPDPGNSGHEQGLDAHVYNEVFSESLPDILFVSSGGGGAQLKHSELALRVLSKAFDSVTLRVLKDRDERTDVERAAFLAASTSNRMLTRREVENYLFDFEVLSHFSRSQSRALDRAAYDAIVTDIVSDDLKVGQVLQRLTQLCGASETVAAFKKTLANYIIPGMNAYESLKVDIM